MANRVEASETTEREIDIAVREIVVKPFHRATEMLRAPRANLAEGARLLLAQETGDRRSIPCDPLDRCEGSVAALIDVAITRSATGCASARHVDHFDASPPAHAIGRQCRPSRARS